MNAVPRFHADENIGVSSGNAAILQFRAMNQNVRADLNTPLSTENFLRKQTTGKSPMAELTREEIDAKIDKSNAQTETKIVRLEGKIDTLSAVLVGKIDSLKEDIQKTDNYNRDSRLIIVASIFAAVIALGGLFVAMMTFGDALFGRGMNVRDVIETTVKDTLTQSKRESTVAPK